MALFVRRANLAALAALMVVGVPVQVAGQSVDAGEREDPDGAGGGGSADELARRVADRTGDPGDVEKLAFTFVVEADGEEKMRRRHVWWPNRGELRVTRGETSVRLRQLGDHDPTRLAESPGDHADAWRRIAPDVSPERAAEAWSWFVNDSYWLLAPAKLFDPGVERELDDEGQLVLTFDGVGLTPGDRYALTVDRERGVVTRWDFELQDGREGAYRWEDYRRFGPLRLSTRRVSVGEGGTVIRFEDVEVVPSGGQ